MSDGRSPYCAGCRQEKGLDGHGEYTRSPCVRCGVRPKRPGRGQKLCAECEPVDENRGCMKCGDRITWERRGAHYCVECAGVEHAAAVARKRARKRLERKRCRGCGQAKTGDRINKSPYCRRCQDRRAAPRRCPGLVATSRECGTSFAALPCDAPILEKHKKKCARCRRLGRERERIIKADLHEWRMRTDPEYRAAEHARKRAQPPATRRKHKRHRSLPGPPLAAAIERRAAALDASTTSLMKSVGSDESALRNWRRGQGAAFPKVGVLIDALGLEWWNVWPEGSEGHADAARWIGAERVAA
jgi:hypothetical protein